MVFKQFHTTMSLDSRPNKGELTLFKGQGACKFGILSRILKILDSLEFGLVNFVISHIQGQGLAGLDSCPGY